MRKLASGSHEAPRYSALDSQLGMTMAAYSYTFSLLGGVIKFGFLYEINLLFEIIIKTVYYV